MKRLITFRHGQSKGNKERIIHGAKSDYGITEEGKETLKQKVLEHKDEFFQSEVFRNLEQEIK